MKKPILKENFLFSEIKTVLESAQAYVDYIDSDNYHEDKDSNYQNDIYEKVMTVLYGDEFWEFFNNKIK